MDSGRLSSSSASREQVNPVGKSLESTSVCRAVQLCEGRASCEGNASAAKILNTKKRRTSMRMGLKSNSKNVTQSNYTEIFLFFLSFGLTELLRAARFLLLFLLINCTLGQSTSNYTHSLLMPTFLSL